jgi:hypothetical protein
MQNQHKKSLPSFKSLNSKPLLVVNFIFGLFWVFFVLFFLAGMIYLLSSSSEETGLDVMASAILFFIFLIALSGIVILLIYSRKKMHTTTIIDEKGIRYINKFNNSVVKELHWSSFAKREKTTNVLESQKYDVSSNTPMKSIFDQFFWPVLVYNKVEIHNDAFLGKHFFVMFYKNRTELIRTFLLGIAHYRPDITVDPAIFESHYINPENYIINYKKKNRIRILSALFCIFIFVIIYYIVD